MPRCSPSISWAGFAAEMNPRVSGFAPDGVAALEAHGWPGNVRELENRMKRAVIMADGKHVRAADLDLDEPEESDDRESINLKAVREIADRKAIRRRHRAYRRQYLGRRQVARHQPSDALRSAEAV